MIFLAFPLLARVGGADSEDGEGGLVVVGPQAHALADWPSTDSAHWSANPLSLVSNNPLQSIRGTTTWIRLAFRWIPAAGRSPSSPSVMSGRGLACGRIKRSALHDSDLQILKALSIHPGHFKKEASNDAR